MLYSVVRSPVKLFWVRQDYVTILFCKVFGAATECPATECLSDWVPCDWVPCDWVPCATECPVRQSAQATECPGDIFFIEGPVSFFICFVFQQLIYFSSLRRVPPSQTFFKNFIFFWFIKKGPPFSNFILFGFQERRVSGCYGDHRLNRNIIHIVIPDY